MNQSGEQNSFTNLNNTSKADQNRHSDQQGLQTTSNQTKNKTDHPDLSKFKPRAKIFNGQHPVVTKVTTDRWSYGKGYTPSEFKIATWNINGIRRAVSQSRLQDYIKIHDPDIICVQQTKICQEAFNRQSLQIPGYQGYWNFCKCSSGYSGVAIFSKFKPIRMIEDFPQNPKYSQEGRVITLQFQNFYLITVYVPLSGLKLERIHYRIKQWDPIFQQHCQQIKKSGKMVIICGDMNVVHKENDMHRRMQQKIGNKIRYKNYEHQPGCTQGEKNSFSLLLSKGWIDAFRYLHPNMIKYSWWNGNIHGRPKNIGRRLDYILVNRNFVQRVVDCMVRDQIGGSDHCPVQMIVKIGGAKNDDDIKYVPFANLNSTGEQKSKECQGSEEEEIQSCQSYSDYELNEYQYSSQDYQCDKPRMLQQANQCQKSEQINADFCHLEDPSEEISVLSNQIYSKGQQQVRNSILQEEFVLKNTKQNGSQIEQRNPLKLGQDSLKNVEKYKDDVIESIENQDQRQRQSQTEPYKQSQGMQYINQQKSEQIQLGNFSSEKV